MKKSSLFASFALAALITACGGNNDKETSKSTAAEQPQSMVADPPSYDPNRGEGKFNEENVNISNFQFIIVSKNLSHLFNKSGTKERRLRVSVILITEKKIHFRLYKFNYS